jgi:hypothetical protein
MRRTGVVVGGVILVLGITVAGCASEQGFRCSGDLVPINAPARVVTAPKSPRAARRRVSTGAVP